jgi:hypothetical protein
VVKILLGRSGSPFRSSRCVFGFSLVLATLTNARFAQADEVSDLVDKIYPQGIGRTPPPRARPAGGNGGGNGNSSGNTSANNANSDGNRKSSKDSDDDDSHSVARTTSNRLGIVGIYGSGNDITRAETAAVAPGVTPTSQAPGATPAGPAGSARAYSRFGIGAEISRDFVSGRLAGPVSIGLEGMAQAGIMTGAKYKDGSYLRDSDNDEKKLGLYLYGEITARLTPFSWHGPVPGSVAILAGGNGVLDSGRYYSSFLGAFVGGRIRVGFSEESALALQYTMTPLTGPESDYQITQHRFEAILRFSSYYIGGRFGIDVIGERDIRAVGVDKSLTANTFALALGIAQ